MKNKEIKIGSLVYHKEWERAIVTKISPSKSLVCLETKNFGRRTVLMCEISLIK